MIKIMGDVKFFKKLFQHRAKRVKIGKVDKSAIRLADKNYRRKKL